MNLVLSFWKRRIGSLSNFIIPDTKLVNSPDAGYLPFAYFKLCSIIINFSSKVHDFDLRALSVSLGGSFLGSLWFPIKVLLAITDDFLTIWPFTFAILYDYPIEKLLFLLL